MQLIRQIDCMHITIKMIRCVRGLIQNRVTEITYTRCIGSLVALTARTCRTALIGRTFVAAPSDTFFSEGWYLGAAQMKLHFRGREQFPHRYCLFAFERALCDSWLFTLTMPTRCGACRSDIRSFCSCHDLYTSSAKDFRRPTISRSRCSERLPVQSTGVCINSVYRRMTQSAACRNAMGAVSDCISKVRLFSAYMRL